MSGSAELSVDELAKVDRISRLVEPDLSGDGRRQQTKGYLIALVRETTGDRCALRAYGSPADRNDCDEILEINGLSVGASAHSKADNESAAAATSVEQSARAHTQLVRHIGECINLKNISLRVKRPNNLNKQPSVSAQDQSLGTNITDSHSNPTREAQDSESNKPLHRLSLLDIFVIGTNAQEQLENFFATSKLIDRNKNNIIKLTNNMEMLEMNNAAATTANAAAAAAASAAGPLGTNGAQPLPLPQSSGAGGQRFVPSQHHAQLVANQSNIAPNQPIGRDPVSLNQAHVYRSQQHQLQHQHQHQQQQQQQQQMARYVPSSHQRVSKHRELPVDVPDSFVGIAKQSPRYPPPKPHRQVSPPTQISNLTTFNHPNNNAAVVAPAQAASTTTTALSSTNNTMGQFNNPNGKSNGAQQQQQPNIPPTLAQSTATNIATHNSSLRSSIKLKQLEKSRGGNNVAGQYPVSQLQPAVNQAFELNEDDAMPSQQQQGVINPHHNGVANNRNILNQINNNTNETMVATKQALKMKHPMPDLCSVYNKLQHNLNEELGDESTKGLADAKLAKLLSIYNTIVKTHNKRYVLPNLASKHTTTINSQGQPEPVSYKVSDLLQSVIFLLRDEELTNDTAELLSILCKHEVEGVCSAFDRIVQTYEYAKSPDVVTSSSSTPSQLASMVQLDNGFAGQQLQPPSYPHSATQATSPPTGNNVHPFGTHQVDDYDYAPDQVQMDIENDLYQNSLHPLTDIDFNDGTCTRTVRITKESNQALGATIKNDVDGSVIIGRIVFGGAAYGTNLLHEGDEILEVNGITMRGRNINEVINIIEGLNGALTFTLVTRNYNKPVQRLPQQKLYVKAFFKYDGEHDQFIPCKELGLSFEKGEILEIIDQSDPGWWQAKREGDSEWRLAGLIPSINMLKQREKEASNEDLEAAYFKHQHKKNLVSILFNCPKGSSPRRRKELGNIPFGLDEIPYYEEVSLYYPNKYRKRPIILVGPKMVGQQEIFKRLLQDKNRFASPVSHTSKPRQDHERNGIDFHFINRAQFEAFTKAGKFIECGQHQNHYYGTSWDAMREVIRSRKTCVHMLNTSSIFPVRQARAGAELKPFFVFVKPDDSHPEKLRNIVGSFSSKSNIEDNIKAIVADVEFIEAHYLPYFDLVITVSDVDRAYKDLLKEIGKIETEPQWIPSFWEGPPAS